MLLGLKSEGVEPTLILWALVRELRGLWQARERDRLRSTARGSGWNLAATPSPRALARLEQAAAGAPAAAGRATPTGSSRDWRSGDAWSALTGLTGGLAGALQAERGFRQGSPMNPMGIFGGTFDPIHYAHLRTAFELQQALRLKEIRFLPAGNPPHRDQPIADAHSCACRWCSWRPPVKPGFVVDDREVRKEGPSYSVETLAELRHEYPDRSLCLIVGMDAFLSLPKWHQWRELLQLAHLVVAHRPGLARARHGAAGRAAGRSRHRPHRRSA